MDGNNKINPSHGQHRGTNSYARKNTLGDSHLQPEPAALAQTQPEINTWARSDKSGPAEPQASVKKRRYSRKKDQNVLPTESDRDTAVDTTLPIIGDTRAHNEKAPLSKTSIRQSATGVDPETIRGIHDALELELDAECLATETSNPLRIRIKLNIEFYRRIFRNRGSGSSCSGCSEQDAMKQPNSTHAPDFKLFSHDLSSLSIEPVPDVLDAPVVQPPLPLPSLGPEPEPVNRGADFVPVEEPPKAEPIEQPIQPVDKPQPHDIIIVPPVLFPIPPDTIDNTQSLSSLGMRQFIASSSINSVLMEQPLLDSAVYDMLEVKASSIHGNGIFASQPIEKGIFLMRYEGEIIGKCMSDKRERNYMKNNMRSVYMFKVDEDIIIDATLIGNKARYINHSCNPNCFSLTDTNHKSILYYSMREIQPGEELTIDYYYSEEHPNEICHCGEPSCKSLRQNGSLRTGKDRGITPAEG